jgi:hypothetical protein
LSCVKKKTTFGSLPGTIFASRESLLMPLAHKSRGWVCHNSETMVKLVMFVVDTMFAAMVYKDMVYNNQYSNMVGSSRRLDSE